MARKKMTAAELMEKLNSDPAYIKMRAEKDALLLAKRVQWRAEEKPLLDDLVTLGWKVESVWDLMSTPKPYPEAIPVLLLHLKKLYSDRIREGIARALATPEAASAWPLILEEYQASPNGSNVKSGLAATLAALSNDEVIDQLSMAAREPANGDSRILLLSGLKKSRSSVARETLKDLKNDPVFAKEIASWGKA